jgi:hypothetical protein
MLMGDPSQPNSPAAVGSTPQRDRNANRRAVHAKFLARRIGGGASATPEAYARAIEQWQQLPGAVVNLPVTNLIQAQAPPTPSDASSGMSVSPTGPPLPEEGL